MKGDECTAKGNSLRRVYPDLTGEERFRLIVRAAVAGDEKESMHLLASSPTVTGVVRDPDFTSPAHASFRLASAFARACGPYIGWLVVVELLEASLTGESGRAFLPRDGAARVAMMLDLTAEQAARDLRALTDAFEEVCRERADLPPEILLRFWVPGVAESLKATEHWIQEPPADPASTERCKEALDQAWTLQLQGED